MQFSKLSAAVLGLSSFAAASPIAVPEGSLAAREATPAEKGLVWSPRRRQLGSSINFGGQFNNKQFNGGLDQFGQFNNKFDQFNNKFGFDNNNIFGKGNQFGNGFDNFLDFCSFDGGNRFNRNNGRNIIIAQPPTIVLNQVVVVQQVNLINVIKKNIFINGGNRFRDNIRRNHFRNVNRRRNNNVNTVIIVVTQIFDISNGNRNQRFLTRQVESNPEFSNKQFVVVSEQNALTVGPSDLAAEASSSTEGVAFATTTSASVPLSTGAPAAAIGARDTTPEVKAWSESTPLDSSSDFLLLPDGQAAPKWEGFATQSQDPASILDDNDTGAFVNMDS